MNKIFKKLSCFKNKVKSLRLFESRSLSSSSSSSFTHHNFDVFLSFRGDDTRKNFTSVLYRDLVAKGIRTFKDDKELVRGRPIPAELIHAIKGSKIAVVVVSANYSASPWCLEELKEIMDRQQKGLITVIPVFYEVEPWHVRRQVGEVAKHFKKHEKRYSKETVESWRLALKTLTSLSGECSKTWEDDAKLLDVITERVSNMLFSGAPSKGTNLIGIEEHMEELYPLLDLNSSKDVRVIGICGRGSIGRSALASHVYENISHNFEAHCFLENVRKIPLHYRNIHLQEELLSKMQGEGLTSKISHRCRNAIKARLRNKKVLLVANDVDNIEQLDALVGECNWFGPGSRIIITTQDRQLLVSAMVKIVYEAELLRCDAVRELVRSLAFKQREDPVGFEQSTYRAMNVRVNLFWTLKQLVSLLCDRSHLKEKLSALVYSL